MRTRNTAIDLLSGHNNLELTVLVLFVFTFRNEFMPWFPRKELFPWISINFHLETTQCIQLSRNYQHQPKNPHENNLEWNYSPNCSTKTEHRIDQATSVPHYRFHSFKFTFIYTFYIPDSISSLLLPRLSHLMSIQPSRYISFYFILRTKPKRVNNHSNKRTISSPQIGYMPLNTQEMQQSLIGKEWPPKNDLPSCTYWLLAMEEQNAPEDYPLWNFCAISPGKSD